MRAEAGIGGTLGGLCRPPSLQVLQSPPLTQPSLAVAGAMWALVALCEGLTPRHGPLPVD